MREIARCAALRRRAAAAGAASGSTSGAAAAASATTTATSAAATTSAAAATVTGSAARPSSVTAAGAGVQFEYDARRRLVGARGVAVALRGTLGVLPEAIDGDRAAARLHAVGARLRGVRELSL